MSRELVAGIYKELGYGYLASFVERLSGDVRLTVEVGEEELWRANAFAYVANMLLVPLVDRFGKPSHVVVSGSRLVFYYGSEHRVGEVVVEEGARGVAVSFEFAVADEVVVCTCRVDDRRCVEAGDKLTLEVFNATRRRWVVDLEAHRIEVGCGVWSEWSVGERWASLQARVYSSATVEGDVHRHFDLALYTALFWLRLAEEMAEDKLRKLFGVCGSARLCSELQAGLS